jgi:DnaK suppressor protein
MPAKKAATKKKRSTVSKKKAPARASRKSGAAASAKKSTRKKVAKRPSRKSAAAPRASAKKKAAKASTKKVSKKTSTKKLASKKAAKKKVAKTSVSKKKLSSKKSVAAKASSKKASVRRASSKKAAVPARSAATRPVASAPSSAPPARPARSANVLTGPVRGFTPYQPKRGESYMSEPQLEHFRQILLAWKRELMEEVDRTMHHMKDDAANFPDPNDRATQESEFGLELRTRDRERKLLKKIDSALNRIDERTYGYCEETGDEIGLRRLEARPVATLCVEAQERRELAERQFRDREDYYR